MRPCSIACAIFFSILIEPGFTARAQDLETTLLFARSEIEVGNVESGLLALQRVAYFAPDSMLSSVYGMLGSVHEARRQFNQAAQYYDRAYQASPSDSMQIEFTFLSLRCEIQQKDWLQAQTILFQLPDNLPYAVQRRKQFYWGLVHFGQADFEDSRQCFISSLDSLRLQDSIMINKLFEDDRRLFRPDPNTAQILSIIIPGAGQLYAGNVRESINSLLLSGGILGMALLISTRYGFWNALFTVMPWFQRYYAGGFAKAKTIAEAEMERRRQALLIDLYDILEGQTQPILPAR